MSYEKQIDSSAKMTNIADNSAKMTNIVDSFMYRLNRIPTTITCSKRASFGPFNPETELPITSTSTVLLWLAKHTYIGASPTFSASVFYLENETTPISQDVYLCTYETDENTFNLFNQPDLEPIQRSVSCLELIKKANMTVCELYRLLDNTAATQATESQSL